MTTCIVGLVRMLGKLSGSPAPGWRAGGLSMRKRVFHPASVLALLALLPALVHASTDVSGVIESDTRWTQAGSPYVVSGELVIRNGAALEIDAGVDVYMRDSAMVTVQAGSLRALGSASRPIRVRPESLRDGGTASPGAFGRWTFLPGAVDSRLEHVVLEYGNGISVQGAAPVFNFLDLRNNLGAAIVIDLEASPTGSGNRARNNGLDGIEVPPGDIQRSVKWGLRGIPYVVRAGTVSVGASPSISRTSPATLEQGQSATITVDGTRLAGATSPTFDRKGLTATVFPGGTSSRFNIQVTAAADADLGPAALRVLVDAGEVVFPAALGVTQAAPGVTAVSPDVAIAGAGVTELTVTGRNFNARSEVLVNSSAIPTTYVSSTELHASLPNQTAAATLPVQVRNPDPLDEGQYVVSASSATLKVQMPVPPTVAFEPAPIAMPPDGQTREILVRLSKADFRDHTLNFSLSDPTKASLSPQTLVIAAGQVEARLAITPLAQGSVTLIAQSPTLAEIRAPLFITPDFRGASTSFALPVGITVAGVEPTTSHDVTVTQQGVVGVSIGGVLTGASPRGWQRGSAQPFTIHGVGIPAGAQLSFVPADGITVGQGVVAADGSTLVATVTADGDAQPGPRRLVVRDAAGSQLVFADAAASVVQLTSGEPQLDSVSPGRLLRGANASLVMRGRNLQGASLEVLPGEGVVLDAIPQVSADGTELRASIEVLADAPLGERVVRVTTASGSSQAAAVPANTFHVVAGLGPEYLTAAPTVGVVVGDAEPPADEVGLPVLTSDVGIVVGASAIGIAPSRAIIGTTTTVTVQGQGLQDVTSVSLVPSQGVVVGAPQVEAEGTRLVFTVEVDAGAELGLRRLVLDTPTGPLAFAKVLDGAFRISAPLAELDSVTPQVATLGGPAQKLAVRGRHLANASQVRMIPADGVTVNYPLTASADGTLLEFAIVVDANAAPGVRSLVVTTPAGDSTSEPHEGNTIYLATQAGPVYHAIAAPLVGLTVGDTGLGASVDGSFLSNVVGVLIESDPPAPVQLDAPAVSPEVRVMIGSVATGKTPAGILQGTSGTLVVRGAGLDQVAAISATPDDGLLFGTFAASADGSQLEIPLSVTADATLAERRLRLSTAGGQVAWVDAKDAVFGIGKVPTMDSTSPIILDAGTVTTLSVRGTGLRNVDGARLLPGDGVRLVGTPVWSQDTYGELLQLTFHVDLQAAPGDRVLQLTVPGGATTATPNPANTVKVVRP